MITYHHPDPDERRKPDWAPGVPAVMADGKVWHFRCIGGPAWLNGASPELAEAMARWKTARESGNEEEIGIGMAMVAGHALRTNYDLEPREVVRLVMGDWYQPEYERRIDLRLAALANAMLAAGIGDPRKDPAVPPEAVADSDAGLN